MSKLMRRPSTKHGLAETRKIVPRKFVVTFVQLLALFSLVLMPQLANAQAVVAPPTFSHSRGFYTSSFSLTLTAPAGTIRYTLNGDNPTASSTAYSGPINITTTSVVRAAAFSGSTKSATVTNTYIYLNAVRTQTNTPGGGWPSTFAAPDSKGTYPADYEMDQEVLTHSNYASGNYTFEKVMKDLPSVMITTDLDNLWDPNYGIYANSSAKEGVPTDPYNNPVSQGKWERPVSIEMVNPDGSTAFAVNGGMRIHGQASRRPQRTPKKSFRLYFKAGYGTGNLDFQLFNDATAVGKFDRLVLRNGGNRQWPYFDRDQRREADYVNDEWARQAWQEMGHLAPHGTYVHLYLNGLYWGLYNIAERIDEKYLAAYHPGTLETDFDLIESEEEQDDNAVASAGTIDAYNELLGLIDPFAPNTDPITDAEYNVIKTKVDVENLADYMIHSHYIGKTDWPDHNWNLYRLRTGADTRFKFIAWDNDSGLNKVTQNTTTMTETVTYPFDPVSGTYDYTQPILDAPIQIFYRLTTNAEFRQVLTDRFYKNVIDPTGVLAPANCDAMYRELTAIVDKAVIGESARWGDYMRDVYPPTNVADKPFPAYLHSRDLPNAYTDPANAVTEDVQKNWLQVRTEKLNTYCPNRSAIVKSQYELNGWYVAPLQVPGISQRGGTVPTANPQVTLNNLANGGNGDIYYTTNGTDPRNEFGSILASPVPAINGGDSATITINRAMTLKARVRDAAGQWSPLLEYDFAPTQAMSNLVINEIHYNPAVPLGADAKQYEFIELYNKGTTPIQLDRVSFSRGITYTFPANKDLQPGEYLVLASNPNTFQSRYGFQPYAGYNGSLANEGESVELLDAVGTPFGRVDYNVLAPWATTPNGTGPSLSLISPSLNNTLPASWNPSTQANGTPGAFNFTSSGPQTPSILWTNPGDIGYGTALTAAQLNASISGAPGNAGGTFTYDPPIGTVLQAGFNQQLRVTFTPNDTTTYSTATAVTYINVLKAPLTAIADNKIWQKSTPFPALTVSYTGFVNGDTAAVLDTPPVPSTTATPSSPEGDYPITLAEGADNNYTLQYVNGIFKATTKSIPTVTWTPAAITYGTPLGAGQLNAQASYNGQAVPGTFSYTPAAGLVLPAGNGQVLTGVFTPSDSATYTQVNVTALLDVAKAPLLIQAADKVKQVGTPNPTFTAIYSGFVNGDTAASLDAPPVFTTTATTDSPAGNYPIQVTGASDANYLISFVPGNLIVTEDIAMPYKLYLPLTVR